MLWAFCNRTLPYTMLTLLVWMTLRLIRIEQYDLSTELTSGMWLLFLVLAAGIAVFSGRGDVAVGVVAVPAVLLLAHELGNRVDLNLAVGITALVVAIGAFAGASNMAVGGVVADILGEHQIDDKVTKAVIDLRVSEHNSVMVLAQFTLVLLGVRFGVPDPRWHAAAMVLPPAFMLAVNANIIAVLLAELPGVLLRAGNMAVVAVVSLTLALVATTSFNFTDSTIFAPHHGVNVRLIVMFAHIVLCVTCAFVWALAAILPSLVSIARQREIAVEVAAQLKGKTTGLSEWKRLLVEGVNDEEA